MALPVLVARDGTERRIPVLAPPSVAPAIAHNKIIFLHPGYGPSINVLFALLRADRASNSTSSGPSVEWGVHHRTALTACQILANNAFNGYLALDAEGSKRIDETVRPDDVLTKRKYYFIVPGDDRYPVVPSFRDWQFPHDSLPDFWPQPISTECSPSGGVCVITKYPWAVSKAHVVPSAQAQWFNTNSMAQYSDSPALNIDGNNNMMPLKLDIHDCLDRFMFTLVPKPQAPVSRTAELGTEQQSDELCYTLHVLAPNQSLFTQLHHDIQLPDLQGVAREFLFARFALAIFMNAKPFITSGYQRRIARHKMVNEITGPEVVVEDVDGPELLKQYGGGKSRSASPSKRKRSGAEDEADYRTSTPELWDEPTDDIDSVDEFIETSTDQWYRQRLEEREEEERGRPRKRTKMLADQMHDGAILDE